MEKVNKMTLCDLKPGQKALVLAVKDGLCGILAARGVAPGAEVVLLRRGNPAVLGVGEARWAMDKAVCSVVEVIPLESSPVPQEQEKGKRRLRLRAGKREQPLG